MTTKLILIGTARAVAILAVATCILYAGSGTRKQDAKIKELKWQHELCCDISRNSIKAADVACRLGIPLSNYLASVEAGWSNSLSKRIAEAEKETP